MVSKETLEEEVWFLLPFLAIDSVYIAVDCALHGAVLPTIMFSLFALAAAAQEVREYKQLKKLKKPKVSGHIEPPHQPLTKEVTQFKGGAFSNLPVAIVVRRRH